MSKEQEQHLSEAPEPKDSGSAGTQQPSPPGTLPSLGQRPLEGLPLARTIEGLAASRSRSLGGEVVASLIAGYSTQMASDLHETRTTLQSLRTEYALLNEKLTQCREDKAVLSERLYSEARNKHLRHISITGGTALVGIAIEFMRNNLNTFAMITGGIGLIFLFFGWFSSPKEKRK